MKAERISIYDIMGIGRGGSLSVTLPSYKATVTARNLVQYVRNAYPREDGLTYSTTTDKKTNTITISVKEKNHEDKQRHGKAHGPVQG